MGRYEMDSRQRSPPITQSPDNAREEGGRAVITSPFSKTPSPRGAQLEPLSEDEDERYLGTNSEHRGLTRSTSSMQMRDLRDQMHDLKGRLSVLRDRTRDDTMKRRSLQSLRMPNPFTAAEQWYIESRNYGDALSADAGVAHAPWKDGMSETKGHSSDENVWLVGQSSTRQVPEYASSDATSIYEDVSEGHHATGKLENNETEISEEEKRDNTAAEEAHQEYPDDDVDGDYNDEVDNREEADDYESDVYHDTLTMPISHEDREDAFDYEHFFLHSSMGTISQQRHRRRGSVGSYGSDDSAETTRGPIASTTLDERISLGHLRSDSGESVSTMDSFATATEGLGSEDGNENDRDNFAVKHVVAPRNNGQPTAHETMRPRDGRHGNNIHRPSVSSSESNDTRRGFPLVNKSEGQKSVAPGIIESQQISSILDAFPTLMEGQGADGDGDGTSLVHMLARGDQILVKRLVASLGKCVLALHEAGRGGYEGRVLRRRLDAARRTLEGQEGGPI